MTELGRAWAVTTCRQMPLHVLSVISRRIKKVRVTKLAA